MDEDMKPTEHRFWRSKIIACIENGKEDEILSVEDYLEGAMIEAYEMGLKDSGKVEVRKK